MDGYSVSWLFVADAAFSVACYRQLHVVKQFLKNATFFSRITPAMNTSYNIRILPF